MLSKEEKFEMELKRVLMTPHQKLNREFRDWKDKAKGKNRIHQF